MLNNSNNNFLFFSECVLLGIFTSVQPTLCMNLIFVSNINVH